MSRCPCPVSLAALDPLSCFSQTKGRRALRSPCTGARLSPAQITPGWITPGAGLAARSSVSVRAQEEVPWSRSARCRGTALTWLSSARPGLAPALPAPRTSPAQAAAQRRGGCPAPGLRAGQTSGRRLAPIPLPAPCLSRKALLGRSAGAHVSGAVSTPSHPLGVRSCQFHLWAVLTTLGDRKSVV